MRVEWSGLINRPIEEVFGFITDPFDSPRRGGGTLSLRVTPPGPLAVGSTVRLRLEVFGLETEFGFRITEWKPPTAVTGSIVDEGSARSGFIRTTLETTPEGTRLVTRIEVKLRGIWRLLGPMAGPYMRRQARRRMKNLERLLEAGPG